MTKILFLDEIETETETRLGPNALWTTADFPRRGWTDMYVDDLGPGVREKCEACDYQTARFIHVLEHPDWLGEIRVGCVCAGRLIEDYERARDNQRTAENRAAKLAAKTKREREARFARFLNRLVAVGDHTIEFNDPVYRLKVWRYKGLWFARCFNVPQAEFVSCEKAIRHLFENMDTHLA